MDPRVNSVLLQLKAKKKEDLTPFERTVKEEINDLARTIETNKQRITNLEESILQCKGALDQTIQLYIKYLYEKKQLEEAVEKMESDEEESVEIPVEVVDDNLEDEEPCMGNHIYAG